MTNYQTIGVGKRVGKWVILFFALFSIVAFAGESPSKPAPEIFEDGFETGDIIHWNNGVSPSIIWTPETITETLLHHEPTITTLQFTANENLGTVLIRVVPALSDFIQVSPSDPFPVSKGDVVTVTLSFSSLSSEIGIFDGVIQVRSADHPPRNFAKPLPVLLEIQPFPLPPDPGDAGLETMEGLDIDSDGTRDDLQRIIAFAFPEDESLREQFTLYAQALQHILEMPLTEDHALQLTTKLDRIASCIHALTAKDTDTWIPFARGLRANAFNTEQRTLRYLEYDHFLSGHVFDFPRDPTVAEFCD